MKTNGSWIYKITSLLIWLTSGGLIYIGGALILLAPVLGPRGNIDYLEFSADQKRRADLIMYSVIALGVIVSLVAGMLLYFRKRVAIHIMAKLGNK